MYKSLLEAIDPFDAVDHYKISHRQMYPKGIEKVYSNFTPRSAKYFGGLPDYDNKVVVVGLQGFIKWFLIQHWNDYFFNQPIDLVVERYKRRYGNSLGPDSVADVEHIKQLHALGYLPLEIKAIEEGSRVNIQIPVFTVTNTDKRFAWLPNFLETSFSSDGWKSMTTATTFFEYRRLFEKYAKETGGSKDFVKFQGHCFALRGLSGFLDGAVSGFGQLLSFRGTDTVPAIGYAEAYYNADATKELVGCSVPASEHSVMTSYGKENEIDAFKRLILEVHPNGIVSIVADSFDFWSVITEFTVILKDDIMRRDGTVTFRPDSGDPVRICAGYREDELVRCDTGKVFCAKTGTELTEHEVKGSIQCLWDVFGGITNDKGYRTLDSHVKLIYGDSITLARADEILRRLAEKGFASDNMIFGVGSLTSQYKTRDSLGFAMKATYCEVDSQPRDIFKEPKTDAGKRSARGLLRVDKVGNDYVLRDKVTWEEEKGGELKTVFLNGKLVKETSLSEIRARIDEEIERIA